MKKLLILTAVGAILSAPAIAASKCIPMLSKHSYNVGNYGASNSRDFVIYLDPASPYQTNMYGVAACSSTVPSSSDIFYATTSISMTDGDYCWCRIISPAVSKWFSVNGNMTISNCKANCAQKCADTFKGSSAAIDVYASDFWTGY